MNTEEVLNIINANTAILIAQAIGVDATNKITTALTFMNGASLAGYCGVHCIVKRSSGDLTSCIIDITDDGGNVWVAGTDLTLIAANNTWGFIDFDKQNPTLEAQTGNINVNVGANAGQPGTFDIKIYGIKF